MKKYLRKGILLLLAMLLSLCSFPSTLWAEEGKELKYMAYNFYSSPDLSKTSYRFDSFIIDFRSDKAPLTTYWSLANFGMDLSSVATRRAYRGIEGYGAYAGLQNSNAKMGILGLQLLLQELEETDAHFVLGEK